MLCLSRRLGESIIVGDDIRITVRGIYPGRVLIGIKAPDQLPIVREELLSEQRPDSKSAFDAGLRPGD